VAGKISFIIDGIECNFPCDNIESFTIITSLELSPVYQDLRRGITSSWCFALGTLAARMRTERKLCTRAFGENFP
jgi:hypothetical protein